MLQYSRKHESFIKNSYVLSKTFQFYNTFLWFMSYIQIDRKCIEINSEKPAGSRKIT